MHATILLLVGVTVCLAQASIDLLITQAKPAPMPDPGWPLF
jgi:hypothetical protein